MFESRISSLLPLLVILFLDFSHVFCGKCTVTINEININGPNTRTVAHDAEFVELKSNCAGTGEDNISLHDYRIVMWRGASNAHEPAEVQYVMNLEGYSFKKESPFLVITAPGLYERLINNAAIKARIVSSAELLPKVEHKNVHDAGFLDNGKKRTMGLAVYRDSVSLSTGDTLGPQTANLEKLDDILLYHEHGSGKQFADIFFQGYELPGIEASKFALFLRDVPAKDENKTEDHALSYCCMGKDIAKWPLAFKRAEMTPGLDNNCDNHAKFVLDASIGKRVNVENRCNPAELARLAKMPTEKSVKTHHGKKKDTSTGNGTLDAVAQALLGTDMSKTMESMERQVSLLASVIGGLVSVAGIVILVVLTVYFRRKRRTMRTAALHAQPLNPMGARYSIEDEEEMR